MRALDNKNQIEPTGTVGVEYKFPFRLNIGGGWHSKAGWIANIGYGVKW